MGQINWNKFKYYKQEHPNPVGLDNFQLLLEFIRGFYKIVNIDDIYEILADDDLSAQMLNKRGIRNAIELDNYLYQLQLQLRTEI